MFLPVMHSLVESSLWQIIVIISEEAERNVIQVVFNINIKYLCSVYVMQSNDYDCCFFILVEQVFRTKPSLTHPERKRENTSDRKYLLAVQVSALERTQYKYPLYRYSYVIIFCGSRKATELNYKG